MEVGEAGRGKFQLPAPSSFLPPGLRASHTVYVRRRIVVYKRSEPAWRAAQPTAHENVEQIQSCLMNFSLAARRFWKHRPVIYSWAGETTWPPGQEGYRSKLSALSDGSGRFFPRYRARPIEIRSGRGIHNYGSVMSSHVTRRIYRNCLSVLIRSDNTLELQITIQLILKIWLWRNLYL